MARIGKVVMMTIYVSDLDKAMKWYHEVLGFEVSKKNYNYPVAVDLVHEGIRLLLHKCVKPTHIDYLTQAQTSLSFETDDIVEAMDEFARKDVEFLQKVPDWFPHGLFAAFRDPFGNVHELIEFKSSAEIAEYRKQHRDIATLVNAR